MLCELLKSYSIEMNKEKIHKLEIFIDAMMTAPFNLTAVKMLQEAYLKHVIEVLLPFRGRTLRGALVDVGSGGGVPGVPLAIVFDDLEVWAIESVRKKTEFLAKVVEDLCLRVHVLNGRAEKLAHVKDYRERFDYATSRALGKLPVALELMAGFVKKGGCLLLYRGRKYDEERRNMYTALQKLALEEEKSVRYRVASKDLVLAIFRKTGVLDTRYPRRPGIPEKRPL